MLEVTILKIWIIGILLSSALHFFRKKKSTALYCGIFGFSGDAKVMNKTMAKLALNKMKILGLYNVDRGKHSCGIYINDQLIKGVDQEKEFQNFIAKKYLPDAMESGNFTMIGHTRAATVGEHTIENAHPFMVDNRFVMAHNGTIKNIWALCDKYGINYDNIKVDSLALANLIYKEGWQILEQYAGFAALLMAYRDQPNTLYFYRGVSKRYKMATTLEEERPLYYLKTEEGIYFSSIEKSLQAISEDDTDDLQVVPASTVFKVENGEVSEHKFVIDRGEANFGIYQNTTSTDPKPTRAAKVTGTGPTATTATTGGTNTSGSKVINFDKIVPVIWHETLPLRVGRWKFHEGIVFHQGRFWVVDNDIIKPAHGEYYTNNKGRITLGNKPNRFFIDGIMMKNKKAYEMAKVDPNIWNPNWNYMMYISKYSEYPVCASRKDINERCKEVPVHSKYRWYENEAQVGNKSFTPVFSDRHYYIKDGLLDKISTTKTIDRESLIDLTSLGAERKSAEELAASKSALSVAHRQTEIPDIADAIKLSEFITKNRQTDLPFEDSKLKVFKGDDIDVTNFHVKLDSIDHALAVFSLEEQRAIRYYIADAIHSDGLAKIYNVYDSTVDVQLNMFLQTCIDNDATVSDNWNQNEFADIASYIITARANKDGSYIDYIDNEAVVDACCSWKPEEKSEPKVKGVQQGWFVMDSDKKDDEEPSMLEHALSYQKEQEKFRKAMGIEVIESQTNIPTEEDEEEYGFRQQNTYKPVPEISNTFDDDQTEKEIAFEETLDSLLKARDEADAFQAMTDDFSQEMAHALYIGIDPILKKFEILTAKHKETNSQNYLKRNINERVKS